MGWGRARDRGCRICGIRSKHGGRGDPGRRYASKRPQDVKRSSPGRRCKVGRIPFRNPPSWRRNSTRPRPRSPRPPQTGYQTPLRPSPSPGDGEGGRGDARSLPVLRARGSSCRAASEVAWAAPCVGCSRSSRSRTCCQPTWAFAMACPRLPPGGDWCALILLLMPEFQTLYHFLNRLLPLRSTRWGRATGQQNRLPCRRRRR